MNKLHVIVVEDDWLVAESILSALTELGYRARFSAHSYTEAVELIQKEKADFAMIDIQLAGEKDGIDFAEYLNKHIHIPFIFLTGNTDKETIQRAQQVHPSAYLVKPFQKEELYSSIEIGISNFQNKAAPTQPLKDFLFVKENDIYHKIDYASIDYVKSENVYLNIFSNHRTFIVREKLDDFLLKSKCFPFVKIHRSFAVNIHKLTEIHEQTVKLGEQVLPLHQNYKQGFLEQVHLLK